MLMIFFRHVAAYARFFEIRFRHFAFARCLRHDFAAAPLLLTPRHRLFATYQRLPPLRYTRRQMLLTLFVAVFQAAFFRALFR